MARPLKEGLDYFSLDCYMDDKIKAVQAEFGLKGFAIVVKLFQVIYREQGYYCEWTRRKELLFAHEECSDCGVQLIENIVNACIEEDIFSKEMFKKYKILTSRGIQKRYFSATAKRKLSETKKEYLLVKVAHNEINAVKNSVNAVKNSINDVDNAQSKVKESKVNNIRASAPPQMMEPDSDKEAEQSLAEDDEGMDPEECRRLWEEMQAQEKR